MPQKSQSPFFSYESSKKFDKTNVSDFEDEDQYPGKPNLGANLSRSNKISEAVKLNGTVSPPVGKRERKSIVSKYS